MSKHTPGRMPEPREPNGRGYGWKVGPAWLGENSHSEETAANARRIAACWNACEGFSTKALETQSMLLITPSKMVDGPSDADKMRAQRDELLAALERAERKLSAYVGVCTGDKEMTDEVLPMVRAAINKVKGQS